MHPLLIPIGLFLLASLQRGNNNAAPQRGPAPTPPPGGTVPQRSAATRAADARAKQVVQKMTSMPAKKAAPEPKPALVIEHPYVTPAGHAPEQAAVDAAVSHAIREDAGAPPSAAIPTPMPPPQARTPKKAAADLQQFLIKTGRFGTLKDRPAEVKDAQRDLGLTPDGIVGPRTRAAAKKQGVALPPIK